MKSLSGIYVHLPYLCCCRLNTSISNEGIRDGLFHFQKRFQVLLFVVLSAMLFEIQEMFYQNIKLAKTMCGRKKG